MHAGTDWEYCLNARMAERRTINSVEGRGNGCGSAPQNDVREFCQHRFWNTQWPENRCLAVANSALADRCRAADDRNEPNSVVGKLRGRDHRALMLRKLKMRATRRRANQRDVTAGAGTVARKVHIAVRRLGRTARLTFGMVSVAALAGFRITDDARLSAATNTNPQHRPAPRKELRR